MRSAILTNALRANSVLVGEKTMFFCAEDSGVEAGKRETERRRIEDDAFLLLDYAPGPSLSLPACLKGWERKEEETRNVPPLPHASFLLTQGVQGRRSK